MLHTFFVQMKSFTTFFTIHAENFQKKIQPKISMWCILTSSKTFFSPFCVRAEHSTYFTALSSFASRSPISKLKGFCLFFAGEGRVKEENNLMFILKRELVYLASRLLPHHLSNRSESQLGGRGSSDSGVWFLAPIWRYEKIKGGMRMGELLSYRTHFGEWWTWQW